MPIGTIDSANISKSGKTLSVQIGGTWYTTKHFELQNMVGQSITFQTSTSEFNGKPIHWLNDYTDGTAGNTPADQAFQAAHAQAQAPQVPQIAVTPQRDRDASIISQALTKACTAPGDPVEVVWKRYQQFYDLACGKVPPSPQAQAAGEFFSPPQGNNPPPIEDDFSDIPY